MSLSPGDGRVAIILVNWNGWQDCVECLDSVLASAAMRCADIWLVDNDSADGSIEKLQGWCARPQRSAPVKALPGVLQADDRPVPCRVWQANGAPAPLLPGVRVNLVRSGGNLGFAGGNNAGIAAAGLDRYDWFWLLNTDTVIASDALDQLLDRAQADPTLGMVGSTLLYHARPDSVQAMGGGSFDRQAMRMAHIGEHRPLQEVPGDDAGRLRVEAQMAYVVGASMLVRSALIRDVGPMCEDYFLYFEELDWAFRSQGRWTLGYAPGSRVYHKVGGSSVRTQGEFSLNLLYRNQVRFASRFLPARLPALKRSLAAELLRHLLKGRWTAARLVARTLRDARQLAASAPPREQRA